MSIVELNSENIIIRESKGLHLLPLSRISYITCEGYLSSFHIANVKTGITVTMLLKEAEELLESRGFVRVNRNVMVNEQYVRSARKKPYPNLTLRDGKTFPISRRRYHEVIQCLFYKEQV